MIVDVNGDLIRKTQLQQHTGEMVTKTTQDVEPYLDQNHRERCENTGWRGDLHKVASIPMVVIEQWNQEFGCNVLEPKNRHLIMLKLRDRDYSKLRTKEGRI